MSKLSTTFLLSLSTGILLSLAWPSGGFAPLLFIAFVPLLLAQDVIQSRGIVKSKAGIFFTWYLAFFIFNLLTTWWVKYASFFGAVSAIIFNALFMTIVFHLFHITKKRLGNIPGYVSLIVFWISFEFLHMDWDLSWPWLTLGNGFAGWVRMIQWYEFTGVLGGTAWILISNILIVKIIQPYYYRNSVHNKKLWLPLLLVILVPVIYSFVRYETYEETQHPVKVTVVQPNIDPYNEKFSGMSSSEQLERIISLAASVTDSSTSYIVAPETALPDGIWEEELQSHPHTQLLRSFQQKYPYVDWVIGLASNSYYPEGTKPSATARKFTQSPGYYDSYNTAMQVRPDGDIQLHHKSKLVPGVEKMPFPAVFKHIDKFAIDLGGMSGSLGMQDVPSVFSDTRLKMKIAPVICYESIYGDYLGSYIRQGAELIFIITNDGWWSDTPGYRQHLKYATLRAIECRRSIARSANTGISCFINQRGDILQPTKWWVPAAITTSLNANSEITFYARFGDFIGVLALAASALLLLMLIYKRIRS